jgi:periplasmic divalent cation tolerance protein
MIGVVYTTFPSPEKASEICGVLLDERLIACANIGGPMTALYRWEGKVCREQEIPALLKTSSNCVGRLTERLLALHPADVPCVLSFSPDFVEKNFAQWILQEVVRP